MIMEALVNRLGQNTAWLHWIGTHHLQQQALDADTVVLKSGLTIEIFGGYWLKPVSNSQIEATWSDELLDAYMALGERYPDIASEIYVIANAP